MTLALGHVYVIRFPEDEARAASTIAICQVRRTCIGRALVAKLRGRNGRLPHWAKPRWVSVTQVAREATRRELVVGHVIDPVPRLDENGGKY